MNAVAELVASTILCASAVAGAAGPPKSGRVESPAPQQRREVYFDGKLVQMDFVPGRGSFTVGPWKVSARVSHEMPQDRHSNFYVVAPGTQFTEPGAEEFAHNEIVSALPASGNPADWDVYFAIVLDPDLRQDFHSEQELILATQQDFALSEELNFEDIPGATFLRTYLGIHSLEELGPYVRSDGKLPRLVIVPAKLTVKAVVIDPENPPQPKSALPKSAASVLPRK